MSQPRLNGNPDALSGALPPRISVRRVHGTTLHVEVRGAGPAVLLIHGGGEDAEVWRPIAERLPDFTVVTYDRRGTLRSGRDGWPGDGAAQHADDAAALLYALALNDVVVFGASSAGIVALQFALRHPGLVRRALVFEPGLFGHVPDGAAIQEPVRRAIDEQLALRPGDWLAALAGFRRAVASVPGGDQVVVPPAGKDWYAAREEMNAEALVRDDLLILTHEVVDEGQLARAAADIRFLHGTESMPVFRRIASHLAAVRGASAIAVDGVGHLVYYQPDAAAGLIRACAPSDA